MALLRPLLRWIETGKACGYPQSLGGACLIRAQKTRVKALLRFLAVLLQQQVDGFLDQPGA